MIVSPGVLTSYKQITWLVWPVWNVCFWKFVVDYKIFILTTIDYYSLYNVHLLFTLIESPLKYHYYTLYSLSVFSLAKILQLILEMSATYRLVSYPLADNWLICWLRAQCMISNDNINLGSLRWCVCCLFHQNNV